jgi:putative two-component system response regulator
MEPESQKTAETQETLLDLVTALGALIEARDYFTGRHTGRIQKYCKLLSAELAHGVYSAEIDEDFVALIHGACVLHDIGKAALPDSILMKSSVPSEDEREILMTHTTVGSNVIDHVMWKHPESRFLRMARDMARSHHERWDGSGFPDSLAGESIPLCARILSLAKVYDAIRSNRSYAPSFPHDEAVRIIRDVVPSRFDPNVLSAFLGLSGEFDRVFAASQG